MNDRITSVESGVPEAIRKAARNVCDYFANRGVMVWQLEDMRSKGFDAKLPSVERDLMPKLGETVLIHLASQDSWVEHSVVGFYAWGDLKGDSALVRLFVRVQDSQGYLNARLLKDVRRLDETPFIASKRAAA